MLLNNYLYNDKELFEQGNLDWYNYGFWNYDPQIARFTQLDPLTDGFPELTPYQYASDEPIANVDLDGLEKGGVLNAVGSGTKDFTYMYSAVSDATAYWNPVMHAAKAASTSGKLVHVVLPAANMALHAVQVTETIINGPITTKGAGNAAGNRPQVGPGPRPLGPIGQLFMMTVGQGLADLNTILTGRDGNNNKVGPGGRVMSGLNLLMLGAVGDDGEGLGEDIPEIKIIPENKIDRSLLNPPTKKGNAPTFKSDNTSVEIHHVGQNSEGPYKEMHWREHRGAENDKINHPNKSESSKINRKLFSKMRAKYWFNEYFKE